MCFLFLINSLLVHSIAYYFLNKGLNSGTYNQYLKPRYFISIGILSTLVVLPFTIYHFVVFNYYALQGGRFLNFWINSELYTFQMIASVIFPIFIVGLYFLTPLHRWILNNFKIYLIIFVSLFIIPLIICWYLDVHIVNLIFFWFFQFFESNLDNRYSCGKEIIDRLDLMWLFALNPYQLFVCNYIFGFNTMMLVKKIVSNESPEIIPNINSK